MGRVTLKGLLAHKLRLALTAIAIVLGVTFISGTFVLTDTLRATFSTLFGNIYQHVDFEVRGVAQFNKTGGFAGGEGQRNPIPASLLPTIEHLPGVAAASGSASGFAQFIAPDGKAVSSGGAPALGFSFDPNPELSQLHVVQGRAPSGPDDVAMDAATAAKYHFRVGDRVRMLFIGPPRTFTITGIVRFGSLDNLAGATLAAFSVPTAQQLFNLPGQFNTIDVVAAPGTARAGLQRSIQAVLPSGVEVVTGQTVANEQTNAINQGLGFFTTALLIFAFIALFVGAFNILNTFSIIVGQRTRELALLRIVGASASQIFRSVIAEAAIVGAVSSAVGIGLGVLAAMGLEALIRGFGIDLPTGGLVFQARTVEAGLVVGTGVTVLAAISPARRAVRIPPVAAIAEQQVERDVPLRRRFAWGGAVTVLGLAAFTGGLAGGAVGLVGLGALAIFIGVAMLAPAIARPLASTIGRPLASLRGTPGRLGRQNAMRSPRRTAQSASALMIGLALVSTMAVFGASVSRSVTRAVDDAITADVIVSTTAASFTGQISTAVPATVARVPGVVATSAVEAGRFEFKQSVVTVGAISTERIGETVHLSLASGSVSALGRGELLIDTNTAKANHLVVGSVVPVKFAETGDTTMTIGGIYQPNPVIGSYLVSQDTFARNFRRDSPQAVLARTDGSPGVVAAVRKALAPYPNLQVQTRAQFDAQQNAQVNKLLALVYALLGLAIVIALIGIINTLVLAVLERTREIGLLRAVGMRRRQVRSMIRAESVILALFGAVLGVVVGTGLGMGLVSALSSQGITETAVPFSTLVVFLVLSGLLGLLAATWPARRAAHLDVLAAISTE